MRPTRLVLGLALALLLAGALGAAASPSPTPPIKCCDSLCDWWCWLY